MSVIPWRAIAWDVDGTLIDSEPLHLQALRGVCAAHGVDIADFGPQPFIGVSIDEVWRRIGARFGTALGDDEAQAGAAFRRGVAMHYCAGAAGLRPLPGALQTLRALAGQGVPMCAVSNSEAAIVQANLDALGVRALLRFAVTLDDVVHPKPHPQPYRLAAARLGLPPSQVLAVEDSDAGMRSALAAGLAVLRLDPEGTAPLPPGVHRVRTLHEVAQWWQGHDKAGTPAPERIAPGAVRQRREMKA